MKKPEEPRREEYSSIRGQEQVTAEVRPGQHTVRAIFPEDIMEARARTCLVSVVILGPDDSEVITRLKDPITRKSFSVGDKVVRYDLDGEQGAVLAESLSFINRDRPFQELLVID
ncbi:MAG: hypothetical protein V1905_02285 [bacterium]